MTRSARLRAAVSLAWHRLFLPRDLRPFLRRADPWLDWLAHNRLHQAATADLQDALQRQAGRLPRISVIMPVYRPDMGLLAEAVESVRSQIFTDWQLCICDDGSGDDVLRRFLADLVRNEARIRVSELSSNGGISVASNTAATLADGQILLFLDQDDLISRDCLGEFALAFATNPDLELAYSDHDKIEMDGRRHSPSFKPGWSPTLLLSHMYMGHALAVKRSLFTRVGGMRPTHDGSQDHDFALRASEDARAIGHIPRLLYHWRCAPGSTAISAASKPQSIAAGQRAVADAVSRRKLDAKVIHPEWARQAGIALFGLEWPKPLPCLTILLVAADRAPSPDWREAIGNLLPAGSQIEVVATGAGMTQALRAALSMAGGRHVLLLEDGTTPRGADDVVRLLGHANRADVGLVGARLEEPGGNIAAVGLVQPCGSSQMEAGLAGLPGQRHGPCYRARVPHECLALPASMAVIPATVVDRIETALDTLPPPGTAPALGPWLSAQVRAAGLGVICAADAVGRVRQLSLPGGRLRHDPWHNRNLGAAAGVGALPWLPARHAPASRRPAPVRLVAVSHDLQREGAQSVLMDLLIGLKATGDADPVVITPQTGPLAHDLAQAGIAVIVHAFPPRRARGAMLATHVRSLADLFRQVGAQAVLANTLETHAAVAAAREAGLQALWWQHEGGPWHGYFRHLTPTARARALAAFAMAYRVIQVADATRQAWLPIAMHSNFETIRHAMTPARTMQLRSASRTAARAALGLEDDRLVVLMVGSISARKGQGDVVGALMRLPDPLVEKMQILIAGRVADSSYGDALHRAICGLPADRQAAIRLLGEVDDPIPLYASADIFLCCSRQESAPRAIVEAMESGLPVISTDVDGIGELVQFGCNALSYEPGNVDALAARIEELATSHCRRQSLGEASRKIGMCVNDHDQLMSRFGALIRQAALLKGSSGTLQD